MMDHDPKSRSEAYRFSGCTRPRSPVLEGRFVPRAADCAGRRLLAGQEGTTGSTSGFPRLRSSIIA